jgi:hypothetical protein
LCGDKASAERLHTIRSLYEPHAGALSDYLKMPLPAWVPIRKEKDQWRLLSKLRAEAETGRTEDMPTHRSAAAAFLRNDDH